MNKWVRNNYYNRYSYSQNIHSMWENIQRLINYLNVLNDLEYDIEIDEVDPIYATEKKKLSYKHRGNSTNNSIITTNVENNEQHTFYNNNVIDGMGYEVDYIKDLSSTLKNFLQNVYDNVGSITLPNTYRKHSMLQVNDDNPTANFRMAIAPDNYIINGLEYEFSEEIGTPGAFLLVNSRPDSYVYKFDVTAEMPDLDIRYDDGYIVDGGVLIKSIFEDGSTQVNPVGVKIYVDFTHDKQILNFTTMAIIPPKSKNLLVTNAKYLDPLTKYNMCIREMYVL